MKWGHVFGLQLSSSFSVTPAMLPLDVDAGGTTNMVAWTGWGPTSNITALAQFDAKTPIKLPACASHDFQLWHSAPVFTLQHLNVAVLGEAAKWVPIAGKRIQTVTVSTNTLAVAVTGDAAEVVELAFAVQAVTGDVGVDAAAVWTVVAVTCTLSVDGQATVTLTRPTTNHGAVVSVPTPTC
jgi:hypothetical protein